MSRARAKIIAAVEDKGYRVAELTWEPWGKAAEKEGIPGGWWGRVEPDPSGPGSSGLDWFGGLSWQEAVEFVERYIPTREPGKKFSRGDKIIVVLRGAGTVTHEPGKILRVSKGIAYVDNGPGNDPTPYDAETGQWVGDNPSGFSRHIEITS